MKRNRLRLQNIIISQRPLYKGMTKQILLNKFGKRIIALREQQGITQSELARRSGKDRQNIYRLEKGELNPTLFQLTEIAAALKISLPELVDIQ